METQQNVVDANNNQNESNQSLTQSMQQLILKNTNTSEEQSSTNDKKWFEGFLEARDSTTKLWRKLYFSLTPVHSLEFYTDNSKSERIGSMLLDEKMLIITSAAPRTFKSHCFELQSDKQSLVICAQSEQSKLEWLHEITKSLQERRTRLAALNKANNNANITNNNANNNTNNNPGNIVISPTANRPSSLVSQGSASAIPNFSNLSSNSSTSSPSPPSPAPTLNTSTNSNHSTGSNNSTGSMPSYATTPSSSNTASPVKWNATMNGTQLVYNQPPPSPSPLNTSTNTTTTTTTTERRGSSQFVDFHSVDFKTKWTFTIGSHTKVSDCLKQISLQMACELENLSLYAQNITTKQDEHLIGSMLVMEVIKKNPQCQWVVKVNSSKDRPHKRSTISEHSSSLPQKLQDKMKKFGSWKFKRKPKGGSNDDLEASLPVSKEPSPANSKQEIPNFFSQTASDQPLPLKLLKGETVKFRQSCYYIPTVAKLDDSMAIDGVLYGTNFRIFFTPIRNKKDVWAVVPLTTILKWTKVNGAKSDGEGLFSLAIQCKDLSIFHFAFDRKEPRRFVVAQFEICIASKIEDLFAFLVTEKFTTKTNGWKWYDSTEEYKRIGVPNAIWRLTTLNNSYELSSSYPAVIAVPTSVSDAELSKIATFRSKGRIPALVWKHPQTNAAMVRSSQPMVGVTGSRSADDELLMERIIQANAASTNSSLYIIDSRPKVNAQANSLKGMGYEKSSYKNCVLEFSNIANIHAMREALEKLAKVCRTESLDDIWPSAELAAWLDHIRKVLSSAKRVVELLGGGVSVLVHCSDGWDRTSQTTAIAELLLDPYFRTIKGFGCLIEKEFLSFGHKVAIRSGFAEDEHKDKERSPIFLQFLDGVYQIFLQNPTAFEFNCDFLLFLMDHLFSSLFGTFLCNCEKEREALKLKERTQSIWSFVEEFKDRFTNPIYSHSNSVLDVDVSPKKLALWKEYYLTKSISYGRSQHLFVEWVTENQS